MTNAGHETALHRCLQSELAARCLKCGRRFNHSCVPNAEYGVNEQGHMKVRVIKPVAQGEKAGLPQSFHQKYPRSCHLHSFTLESLEICYGCYGMILNVKTLFCWLQCPPSRQVCFSYLGDSLLSREPRQPLIFVWTWCLQHVAAASVAANSQESFVGCPPDFSAVFYLAQGLL